MGMTVRKAIPSICTGKPARPGPETCQSSPFVKKTPINIATFRYSCGKKQGQNDPKSYMAGFPQGRKGKFG
jgi:hypothetical protein